MTVPDLNTLGYCGVKQKNPPNIIYHKYDPTQFDYSGFDIGDMWINTTTQTSWQLLSKAGGIVGTRQTAVWETIGGLGAQVSTLTPDSPPASPISPVAGNIDIHGTNGILTSNSGAGSLTITNTNTFTDNAAGTAAFVTGNLNILGSNGITTSATAADTIQVGNTATLTADDTNTVAFTSGNITVTGDSAQGVSTSVTGGNLEITVQDASNADKGVSVYTSAEFSTSSGTVSLKGGLVLLLSVPMNGLSEVIFKSTTAPTMTSFTSFMLSMRAVRPVVDTDFLSMQISNDNGATWLAAGYLSGFLYSAYNAAVLSNANSATYFVLSGPIDNGSQYNCSLSVYNLNTAQFCSINGVANYEDTVLGTEAMGIVSGIGNTGINALRLTMSTGNFSTGQITLYGIKET